MLTGDDATAAADVILDASNKSLYQAGQVFYVYSRNLDQLSNAGVYQVGLHYAFISSDGGS